MTTSRTDTLMGSLPLPEGIELPTPRRAAPLDLESLSAMTTSWYGAPVVKGTAPAAPRFPSDVEIPSWDVLMGSLPLPAAVELPAAKRAPQFTLSLEANNIMITCQCSASTEIEAYDAWAGRCVQRFCQDHAECGTEATQSQEREIGVVGAF